MSRNASGTYSLPAGNPVTTGTTIDESWANDTMSDLRTEMTDSLSRTGKGGMLAALKGIKGIVAAPAVAATDFPGTGAYWISATDLRVSVSGVDRWRWRASGNLPQVWDVAGAAWVDIATVARAYGSSGGNVASADEIDLGDNGNYFSITGTTTINKILNTGWTTGSIVALQFTTTVTIGSDTADPTSGKIHLVGDSDFISSDTDTLTLQFNGAIWREYDRFVTP